MTNISNPIIFFGTESFSLVALAGLIDAGYPIAAVVTKPDSKKGRGQHLTPPEVKVLAAQHNIPVWQPTRLDDIAGDVKALGSVTGVLVSYGRIIPQSVIDLFTPGIINVHPSLLPRYRGPSPIESAIKNGDDITGVSIMQLVAAMDAGPVYVATQYPLSGTETSPELYQMLADRGTQLLIDVLPTIIDGSLQPQPQDQSQATYCQLLSKADSHLDLTATTAVQAERIVRAQLTFPKTKVTIDGHELIITVAHVSNQQKTPLDVKCQDGAFLSIDQLITPAGRRTDAAGYLRGYAAAS